MDYLEVLKVFRNYYGLNQKYYSELHPILYYNDEIYTNPFLSSNNVEDDKKETKQHKKLDTLFENYSLGFNRTNFLDLLLRIFRDYNNFKISIEEVIYFMIEDYNRLNLYNEYKLKQYKIKKTEMSNILYNKEFHKKEFMQFASDHFRFNIFIINDNEIWKFYPRNNTSNLSPKIFIYYDIINNRFHQIKINNKNLLTNKDDEFMKYFTNEEIVEIEEEIKEENQEKNQEENQEEMREELDYEKLMKMKLQDLQEIAKNRDIKIYKLNKNKVKMIKKTKSELISDLS